MATFIKPIVRLFFPCDEARLDSKDNKWILKNPWHTVWMPPGVTEYFAQAEIWLYAQFSGGVGEIELSVQLSDEDGNLVGKSDLSIVEESELSGGDQVHEALFYMANVPFDRPGIYEFRLIGNGEELDAGTAYLRVFSG